MEGQLVEKERKSLLIPLPPTTMIGRLGGDKARQRQVTWIQTIVSVRCPRAISLSNFVGAVRAVFSSASSSNFVEAVMSSER